MTIRANKFTPEVLISAPRRSPAIPNSSGTLALFTTSTYSFETHSKSQELRVLDIKTGQSTVLTSESGVSDPTWVPNGDSEDEDIVLWLQGAEKGVTKLRVADATTGKVLHEVASFDGPVSNLKVVKLDAERYGFALTGQITPDGSLFNPEKVQKALSSAKIYTGLFVRQWDSYVTENKSTIWYGVLKKPKGSSILASSGLKNALKTPSDSYSLESPVPPFGGADQFDISKSGLVFIAKDPKLDPANHTKTDLYYVSLSTFEEEEAPIAQIVQTGALRGYCNSPVFSPDAKSVIFTRMKSDQYESDKPRLLLLPDLTDLSNVQEFFLSKDGVGAWDRSPSSVIWGQNGKELYITAEDNGTVKVFKVESSPRLARGLPTAITSTGSAIDIKVLGEDRLFVSSTSLIDSSSYSIIDASGQQLLSSASKSGKAFGLSREQISDITFKGAGDYNVHAWVVKPSNFDKWKKYPLAYLIHGGPQGAWTDSWSTRWNPAIFAEQGYVVVTPNPTGSSGYGMSLQNGIKGEWGGRPYDDLVNGFKYVSKNLSYVDIDRAVCLGASYGGYMCNWIQGHPLGRKFKALVTHDGVFSTLNQYSSDELFFPHHDFGGTLWDDRAAFEKWDPARFTHEWKTPHLIIHNELDYRLPISEGLAPFNVLQTRGVDSKFVSFPDENHWVLKPENSLVWHREVLAWINKYSGVEKDQKDLSESTEDLKL